MWSAGRLDYDLDRLIETDHVNLILEHDKHVGHQTTKSVCMSRLVIGRLFRILILSNSVQYSTSLHTCQTSSFPSMN